MSNILVAHGHINGPDVLKKPWILLAHEAFLNTLVKFPPKVIFISFMLGLVIVKSADSFSKKF